MKLQHPSSVLVEEGPFIAMIGIHRYSSWSGPLRDEIAPAHQVVRSGAEAKQPIDEAPATMPQFAEEGHSFQPSEGLLHQLALCDDSVGIPRVGSSAHRSRCRRTRIHSVRRAV